MPDYTFDTPEPIELYVENGSGRVTVSAADVRTTEVRVTGKRAEEVEVLGDRDRVSVIPPKFGGLLSFDKQLDIDVSVPAGSAFTTKVGSADVGATGRLGAVRVKSGSGDVALDEVTGTAVIDTGSGDIAITTCRDDLRVRSGSGDLQVAYAAADATVSTGSGDVLFERSDGPVQVKTGSGDLEIRRADGDVSMSTGSGDTLIRAAHRGRISSKGASGDVRIGIPVGTPVWTDIRTVTGSVNSRLEGVGEPEPGAPYVELRATTVSGDIELVPA